MVNKKDFLEIIYLYQTVAIPWRSGSGILVPNALIKFGEDNFMWVITCSGTRKNLRSVKGDLNIKRPKRKYCLVQVWQLKMCFWFLEFLCIEKISILADRKLEFGYYFSTLNYGHAELLKLLRSIYYEGGFLMTSISIIAIKTTYLERGNKPSDDQSLEKNREMVLNITESK